MKRFLVSKITTDEYHVLKTSPQDSLKEFDVTYGVGIDTKYGKCVAAYHKDSLCYLHFQNEYSPSYQQISEFVDTHKNNTARIFPNSRSTQDDKFVAKKINQLFDESYPEDVKLLFKGNPFQIKVWEELLKIPRGKTCCYEDIAKAIGAPKAVRAVGTAVGKNPIAYVVPCHRVINKDGSIGKYFYGTQKKLHILKDENAV